MAVSPRYTARNNGVPLITQSPRAKVTKSIEQLAVRIDESAIDTEGAGEEVRPKRRLFSFLGSGST